MPTVSRLAAPNVYEPCLGDVVPDGLLREDCEKDRLPLTLSALTIDFLKSETAESARPGGFVEAFKIPYFDSVGMVTVGGILPARGRCGSCESDGCRWWLERSS